jgi:ATP-dependent Lon protease, bacterial type
MNTNVGNAQAIVLVNGPTGTVATTLHVRARAGAPHSAIVEPCPLAASVRAQVLHVVVPACQAALRQLDYSSTDWELTFILPPSLSLHGETMEVVGNSADLAAALAMWSAATGQMVEPHIAATGEVRDADGGIRVVRGIHHKLRLRDASVTTVLLPDWKRDLLFSELYPQEFAAVRTAVKASTRHIVSVGNIRDGFRWVSHKPPAPVPLRLRRAHIGHKSCATPNIPFTDADSLTIDRLIDSCSEEKLVREIDSVATQALALCPIATDEIDSLPTLIDALAQVIACIRPSDAEERARYAARLVSLAFREHSAVAYLRRTGARSALREALAVHIAEQRSAYVAGVLHATLDIADSEQRLRYAAAALHNYACALPSEWRDAPAEEMAERLHEIITVIARSRDRLAATFYI